MYYVYILFSLKDKCLYIGFTPDIKSRLKKHNFGLVKATKNRLPVKLIYLETYISESDARRRETYLKGGKGKNSLKTQLKNTYSKIRYRHR